MVNFLIFVHKNVYRFRFQKIKIGPLKGFEKKAFFSLLLMRNRLSGGQKWFLKPYFPLIRGMLVFRSDLWFSFRALEVETLGGFHKVALEQAKRIGAAVAGHQGIEDLVATKQLFQRLSVTWMPGNAALLMTSRPDIRQRKRSKMSFSSLSFRALPVPKTKI